MEGITTDYSSTSNMVEKFTEYIKPEFMKARAPPAAILTSKCGDFSSSASFSKEGKFLELFIIMPMLAGGIRINGKHHACKAAKFMASTGKTQDFNRVKLDRIREVSQQGEKNFCIRPITTYAKPQVTTPKQNQL